MDNRRSHLIFKIKKIEKSKKWTRRQDEILIKLVQSQKRKNWVLISKFLKNKTKKDCKARFYLIDPKINRGKWSKEEDSMIVNLVENFGHSWKFISSIIKIRNEKQIRTRYVYFIKKFIDSNSNSNFKTSENSHVFEKEFDFSTVKIH